MNRIIEHQQHQQQQINDEINRTVLHCMQASRPATLARTVGLNFCGKKQNY